MAFGSLPSVLGSGGGTAYSLIGGTGLFADGTAAAPSISFAADTDTGFYRVAANIIGVANNGSISMAFVAGGKIQGAGLDNELALAGNGSVSLRAGGTAQNITLTPSTTGKTLVGGNKDGAILTLLRAASAYSFHLGVTSNSDFAIYDNNGTSVLATITNTNGRLLLGTTTDSGALLQVNGTATFAGAVTASGNLLVTGGSKNFRLRDTGITDANYDTLLFQAYDQNVFAIGVGSLAGTPSQIRINGATNAVAFTGAVSGITTLSYTGGTTATSTGNHVFGTTNTVIMAAGTLTATGAVAIGNTVAAGVAIASTHKVTMVIGGVTYYLLASNV
jgi:hypothetical protein